MRTFVLAMLALACSATPSPAIVSIFGYDIQILDDQRRDCPPRGSHPDRGCDQCLSLNYYPASPLFEVFCGPDRPCRYPLAECRACNGTCNVIWSSGNYRWFPVLGNEATIQNVITSCNQWINQYYCANVTGAYFVGENFNWIPLHQESYRDLPHDPLFDQVIGSFTGFGAATPAEAWKYRVGLFSELSRLTFDRRDYYERAANLALWYYIATFLPEVDRSEALAAAGFPSQIGFQEGRDLGDILEVTCPYRPFDDCISLVEPSTWGTIKERYRDR